MHKIGECPERQAGRFFAVDGVPGDHRKIIQMEINFFPWGGFRDKAR